LAGMLLELRAAGIDPDALPWLDAPPSGAVQTARQLLQRLGALDAAERATDLGRACARLPLHPRLARLVVEAARLGFGDDGASLAALISERRAGPAEDVLSMLEHSRPDARLQKQLARLAPPDAARSMKRDEAIELAVLAGFPDRVARRRGSEVLLAGGGSAQLPQELAGLPEFVVAVEAEERRDRGRARTFVRIAAPVAPELLLDRAREETQLTWSGERERVEEVTRLLYDQVVLEETRRPAHVPEMLLKHAENIPDPESISALRARAEIAGIALRDVEQARRAVAARVASLSELRETDFAAELLTAQERALLDRLAPASVTLPGGRKVRVEYVAGQPPAIRSRLQDFFGMRQTPSIAGGRVPLTLHLLAPNGRAQQVTQDLAGFWERHYPAVRRELMRKYPKHAWPENGATAAPPSVNRRPQR
ncbi:MAG TPA: ATP-dependent helicase C-terminal domain-containing protein, partial [Myxococcales bacterium]|nr:ATP-dependent helicase C-terminal domain-containing protein [Myxococcales bacterium]